MPDGVTRDWNNVVMPGGNGGGPPGMSEVGGGNMGAINPGVFPAATNPTGAAGGVPAATQNWSNKGPLAVSAPFSQSGSLAGNTNPVGNVTPQPNPQEGWLTGAAMQGIGAASGPFNSQWYDQLGSNLWNQASTNYLENINPALQSSAIMSGGYGGDRAALAQGVAAGKVADSVNNAMAPLYAQGYEQNLNRNLQAGNTALSGVLGLGGLDMNRYNTDANLGLGYYNAETNRQLGTGNLQNQGYGLETQRQLGMGNLDLGRYVAENEATYRAGTLNNPQTTNPWGAGLGALLGLYPLLFGQNQGS